MGDLRDDLVRRGDVMDELVKEYNRRWQEGGLKLAWIEKAVDSVRPVEDVVPVVRCKDCKHNYSKKCHKGYNHEDIVCDYWDTDGLSDDGFCSRAERSEE